MPQNSHDRMTLLLAFGKSFHDQHAADSSALLSGQDGQWGKRQSLNPPLWHHDMDLAENNVADDLIISLSHQRDFCKAPITQGIDEVGLDISTECRSIDLPDRLTIGPCFSTDSDAHEPTFANPAV